jgi:hypothetical protein
MRHTYCESDSVQNISIIKKVRLLLLILWCPVILVGCDRDKDEEPDGQFTGSIQSIEGFLTPELADIMTELGMEFNTGNTPPNIEGAYLTIPILEATNVSHDVIGSSFSNSVLKFEEQNNMGLSVKFSYTSTEESGEGTGALIAGKDNLFSVLLKVSGENHNSPAETAMVISGRLVPQGIENFQWAVFMLENYGSPHIIKNGQGRILVDKNNLAVKTTANGKLKLDESGNSKTMMAK